MTRKQQLTAALMTILTGVGIFVFFAFRYRYHLHFQEQYQLFEWTFAYFADVARVPGGLADWLGRCLTQFFYHAPVGAVLLALLFCGVQLSVWAACRRRSLFTYGLAFIPALLLVVFFCDENALTGSIVALALSLAVAALCQRVASRKVRRVLDLVLLPVLYMACGPLCILFAVAAVCHEVADGEGKPWLFAIGTLAVAAACVLVAWRVFPYPFNRLVQGVHYHRFHNILPGLLYAAAAAAALVVLVSCLKVRKPLKGIVVPGVLFVVLAAVGTFATLHVADPVKEEWMHYDFMVRMQMWNRIMQQADRHNPDNPKTVSCLNLALAMTGRMVDSQFSYFQNGPEGLIPGFKGDYTNPVSTGEIFWHLGMVNSARFYQRLVETNLVNGDTLVAMKYLKVLEHTTFYRSWARETATLVENGTLFEKRSELARIREFRLKQHDFFFSDSEMDSMLGFLQVEHPENKMALDYLLSWCLLRKDLTRFAECLRMVDTSPLPQTYQEALLLLWVFTHNDFSGLPDTIAPVNVQRINRFMADANAGKQEAAMRASYGNTYWFYFMFRYLNQQP